MVFDKAWFNTHQSKLLWLLNSKLTRRWFRWIMCIDNKDFINRIEPNAFWFGAQEQEGELVVTAQFYTHDKFGKRLFYAFKFLWFIMHIWDFWADIYFPDLSFGFATASFYSSAGAVSPVDGRVWRGSVNETFTTIRGGAGTAADNTETQQALYLESSATTNQFDLLVRLIQCFDTSSLGASAVINSAQLNEHVPTGLKGNGLGDITVHAVGATPASTSALVASDYGQVQFTSFGSITYGNIATNAYNAWGLNSSGITNIATTGVSKFGLIHDWDLNNSFGGVWASATSSYMYVDTADTSGTSSDPFLTVNYNATLGTTQLMTRMGV